MALSEKYKFTAARPVWETGREKEKNVSLAARCVLEKGTDAVLHIAGHTRFRVLVNGKYFASGPARAAKGYYRADEYRLKDSLTQESNVVCIITAGYNANSYYLLDEPSFICAEVVTENGVLFATGTQNDFLYTRFTQREQKVQRYSFQRPFTECYRFGASYDDFFTGRDGFVPAAVSVTEEKNFIVRKNAYPDGSEYRPEKVIATGKTEKKLIVEPFTDRSYRSVGDLLGGYKPEELTFDAVKTMRSIKAKPDKAPRQDTENVRLEAKHYAVYNMGLDTTGYIHLKILPQSDTLISAVFNQKLRGDMLDPSEDACATVCAWYLEGGRSYDLTSFEPYTYRYIQITAHSAPATVISVSQIREAMPQGELTGLKKMPDPALQKIYDAAVETFVQNATDIFMDCPSRERAGWLCDAWFTSQVERELTGKSTVDSCFLENFIMAENFDPVPEGMLPMCYPSDHCDGVYIPNWAMWYVLQLYEHEKACHDGLYLDAKKRVLALADFFTKYENEDGLLEKLDSWVFVEWSKANDFVQDVNYPSNMLYALFCESIGQMYGMEEMKDKAAHIRAEILRQSFDGKFFRDNAVRENGKLVLTENRTETAQYYAFFTKTATFESHPGLWSTLLNEFGAIRREKDLHPDIHPSNAFIGNYLRLILMLEAGENEKLEKDIRGFFLPMARQTGTLWENMTDGASCNHGFASFVALILNKIF